MQKNIFCFLSDFPWNFSNSCGFPLIYRFNLFSLQLVLCHRKHFCSILTNLSNLFHSKWLFLFHQNIPLLSSYLKNFLTKYFTKVQQFTNVLQNRCSYKFPHIYKKICELEYLFDKVTGLMCFHVNITKCLTTSIFMEHLWCMLLKTRKFCGFLLMFLTSFTSLRLLLLFPLSITFFVIMFLILFCLTQMKFSQSTFLLMCLSLET